MFRNPLASVFLAITWILGVTLIFATSVQAQSASPSAESLAAVQAYVESTREVDQSAYSVVEQAPQDNLLVYKVTMTTQAGWTMPAEKIFNVYVDAENQQVTGEGPVQ